MHVYKHSFQSVVAALKISINRNENHYKPHTFANELQDIAIDNSKSCSRWAKSGNMVKEAEFCSLFS